MIPIKYLLFVVHTFFLSCTSWNLSKKINTPIINRKKCSSTNKTIFYWNIEKKKERTNTAKLCFTTTDHISSPLLYNLSLLNPVPLYVLYIKDAILIISSHLRSMFHRPCSFIWNYLDTRIFHHTYLSMHPSTTFSCFVAIRGLMCRRSDAALPAFSTICLIHPTNDSIIYLTPCSFSSGLRPEKVSLISHRIISASLYNAGEYKFHIFVFFEQKIASKSTWKDCIQQPTFHF